MHRNAVQQCRFVLLTGLALSLFGSAPAHADMIVTVQSVSAAANTPNNFFDVTLTNTGTIAVSVDSFTFGISTSDSAISFTDANTSTSLSPYIFGSDTLFGPDLTGPTSGQSLVASDIDSIGAVSVGAGTTVGLGHVSFGVAPGAATGPFAVTLGDSPALTSLSDAGGHNIVIQSLVNGQITITSAAPEPLLFLPVGLALLAAGTIRRRLGEPG